MNNLSPLDWRLYYEKNEQVAAEKFEPTTISAFSEKRTLKAVVPSCFEYLLYLNGEIENPAFSDNVFSLRKYESCHQWYFVTFDSDEKIANLVFDGIDTVADVIVNGKVVGRCDNMFIPHNFLVRDLKKCGNELIVHIYPAVIEARKEYLPAMCHAMKFDFPSLALRKSASSFGWDIMPRFVCGGIWRGVRLEEYKKEKFNEFYLYTAYLNGDVARLNLYYNFIAESDDITNYKISVYGKCGESEFKFSKTPWHTQETTFFELFQPKLWFPRGYGEQNLYEVTVTLAKNDVVIGEVKFDFGIRTVKLERSALAENGKFEFFVNDKKIYILGTNWVPTDALRVEETERSLRGLALVKDVGCNCVRVWGGGVYETDEFYEYCDKNGILVWQDFMMACGVYPETESFLKKIENEAASVVKRLRNHCSIVLWAGDNEGDIAHKWNGVDRSPLSYSITRERIAKVLRMHDALRPYLPSSPLIENKVAEKNEYLISENHLWGPRDYFKGNFYKNAPSAFVSEIGYHGCPSPFSLNRFLKNPNILFDTDGRPTREYLAHCTNSGCNDENEPFEYRIRLMAEQVKTLFGSVPQDYVSFSKASQISQAEAMKYFIERFRIKRNATGGIIWWNILDGWQQVSDAVVDYYFIKKLAYGYIKRSQLPVCFMCDENNKNITLFVVNDTSQTVEAQYKVTEVYSGRSVVTGKIVVKPQTAQEATALLKGDNKEFYLIEWETDGKRYTNHFHTDIIEISLERYLTAIKKCGYDQFEGF